MTPFRVDEMRLYCIYRRCARWYSIRKIHVHLSLWEQLMTLKICSSSVYRTVQYRFIFIHIKLTSSTLIKTMLLRFKLNNISVRLLKQRCNSDCGGKDNLKVFCKDLYGVTKIVCEENFFLVGKMKYSGFWCTYLRLK